MAYINSGDLDKIQDALMSRDEVACLKAMALITAARDHIADSALIDQAREEYGNDECEIDDDAGASEGDTGTWVQAWVWIAHDETEEESDDESAE